VRKRRLVLGFAVAAVLAAGPGWARKPTPTPTPRPIGGLVFSDRYQVTVVNVDVYVRDTKGNPVTGLTKDDFKVFQDGVEMPITNFAAYTEEVFRDRWQRAARPSPGPTPVPEPEVEIKPIWVVIYVDNENVKPLERNRVLRRVREWIRRTLRPPMQAMVVAYEKRLKVIQPFTSDPREVNSALRSLRTHTAGGVDRASRRREIIDLMREFQTQERERPNEGYNYREYKNHAYRLIASFADEEVNNLRFSLGALREMISMMAGLPGRKSVIYVSDGLPMTPGADLVFEYAAVFHDSSLLSLLSRYERSEEFQSLVSFANGLGVRFYTVETKGLKLEGGITAEDRYTADIQTISVTEHNYQDSLRYLADGTGGLAVVNTNDVLPGLMNISKDFFTYYSLGYRINASGADKVHRIEVKCPTHPEYRLRYRRRFVEKSLESRVQDRVLTALVIDFDENPMQVDVEIGRPAPATSERWTVPISVTFPLRKVALLPEGDDYVGRVVLFVAARDAGGKQSDLQRQEHEIRVPAADYEGLQRERWAIHLQLLMQEGSYRVAVGLMDYVTRQASYRTVKVRINPDGG